MKNSAAVLVIAGLLYASTPIITHAQYEGGFVSPVLLMGSQRIPVTYSNVAGHVLGAFTSKDTEKQAQIENIKGQLVTLMSQLIDLLKTQLASAIAAGNHKLATGSKSI